MNLLQDKKKERERKREIERLSLRIVRVLCDVRFEMIGALFVGHCFVTFSYRL